MALPRLNYPTYLTTIPSSGKKTKFRPFTVNEEKILITAYESKDVQEILTATKTVITNCFDITDVDELTNYDVDYLFLQIRGKSVSSVADLYYRVMACKLNDGEPCEKVIKISINLDDVKIQEFDKDSGDYVEYEPKNKVNGGFKIKLSEEIGVIMKHPGFAETEKLALLDDQSADELAKICIVSIYDEESVYDASEYSKQDIDEFYLALTTDVKQKLIDFVDNIPELRYETTFTCKECGYSENLIFNDLESFFD